MAFISDIKKSKKTMQFRRLERKPSTLSMCRKPTKNQREIQGSRKTNALVGFLGQKKDCAMCARCIHPLDAPLGIWQFLQFPAKMFSFLKIRLSVFYFFLRPCITVCACSIKKI
jgi:hypothetical protein